MQIYEKLAEAVLSNAKSIDGPSLIDLTWLQRRTREINMVRRIRIMLGLQAKSAPIFVVRSVFPH